MFCGFPRAVSILICLMLAAFFIFVGYWKALGPVEALAEHRAWVTNLPVWFARTVGWTEIGCAAALVLSAIIRHRALALFSSSLLVVNQMVALAVHVARSEVGEAGPQNVILILLLCGYFFYAFYSLQGRLKQTPD